MHFSFPITKFLKIIHKSIPLIALQPQKHVNFTMHIHLSQSQSPQDNNFSHRRLIPFTNSQLLTPKNKNSQINPLKVLTKTIFFFKEFQFIVSAFDNNSL